MKNKIKFLLLIAFIVIAIMSVKTLGLDKYLDQERLRVWIEGFGIWGPAIYMLTFALAPALMLPGLPITITGGILFGPVWGSVYTSIGSSAGACLAFLVARYLGRGWVESTIGEGKLKELDAEVARQGWKIVAFTRLIPLFPFNLLNYAFGLTRIRFSHYALASFIFMLPATVAYIVLSSSLLGILKGHISKEFVIGFILVVVVSLIPVLYKKRRQVGSGNA